ncbi:MAG TPA: tyrosine--tRNA ligase [Kofleriaceae bacterium]
MLDELAARGLFQECTDRNGLGELLAKSAPVAVYAGFDPTSPSLHVGNLVPTILLKRFQLGGHRPVVVVGGATGMIGDPSGKSSERNLLDEATLAANVRGIHAQLSRLLDYNTSPTGAVMTNNYDWTKNLTYLDFLRDYGKFLTVNYMTAKDSVESRLSGETGISYTEFSYMLLQAYDFVKLAESHGCRLQVGGSDQYGNITAGCELQRKMGRPQLFGWVAPLLLDSSGQKMGKTSTGERVWLDAERTTPFAFYQYFLNRTDEEVPRLLKMFSTEPLARIEEVLREHDADRAKRIAQKELARAMTTWVHGAGSIAAIEASAGEMFGGDLSKLSDAQLADMAGTVPTTDLPRSELEAGISLVDLVVRVGLEPSKGKARTTIEQGGLSVNDVVVKDVAKKITIADLMTETRLVLRKGKKNLRIVHAV